MLWFATIDMADSGHAEQRTPDPVRVQCRTQVDWTCTGGSRADGGTGVAA